MAYEVYLISADGRVEDSLDEYETAQNAIAVAQRQNVTRWAHQTPGVLRKRVEVYKTQGGQRSGKPLWLSQYAESQ